MARTKKVCEEPSIMDRAKALMEGKKAKTKCRRVKVNKEEANSIASQINWGNQNKKG